MTANCWQFLVIRRKQSWWGGLTRQRRLPLSHRIFFVPADDLSTAAARFLAGHSGEDERQSFNQTANPFLPVVIRGLGYAACPHSCWALVWQERDFGFLLLPLWLFQILVGCRVPMGLFSRASNFPSTGFVDRITWSSAFVGDWISSVISLMSLQLPTLDQSSFNYGLIPILHRSTMSSRI